MGKAVKVSLFLFVVFCLPLISRAQAITLPNPLEYESFEELAENIMSIFVALGLALSGLAIVLGAFFILTSAGEPRKYKKGRDIILYAILGIVIIMLARGITALIRYSFGVGTSGGGGGGGGDEGGGADEGEETCEDECPQEGRRQCTSSSSYRTCIMGEDGCLDWGESVECPTGEECTVGYCHEPTEEPIPI